MKAVLDKARTNFTKMKISNEYVEGICPYFSTGRCMNPKCTAAHLFGLETPDAWAAHFCRTCGDATRKIMEERSQYTPNKRQRGPDK